MQLAESLTDLLVIANKVFALEIYNLEFLFRSIKVLLSVRVPGQMGFQIY